MALLHASPTDSSRPISGKKLSTQKSRQKFQESEPVNQDHNCLEPTKTYQVQNLKNNEQTHSETGTIQVSPREVPENFVVCLIDNLEEALKEDNATKWGELCIYRIPGYLREKNEWYYPQTISLGPYHYGRAHLRAMDRHKLRAVNTVLNRTKRGIQVYVDAMKELEEKARACYEGPIALNSKDFTEMLVLDGCFVLEYIRGVDEGFSKLGYVDNDPVFVIRGSMHSIQRDMIMLENQLPLFVLDQLLELQGSTLLVEELAVRFFKRLMPLTHSSKTYIDSSSTTVTDSSTTTDIAVDPFAERGLHLLDVFRQSLLNREKVQRERRSMQRLGGKRWSLGRREADGRPEGSELMLYRVTELRDAGIKFKKSETDRFWDIKFENGYLQIPKLLIHDGTKSLLWNLVTFEQCHINLNNDITVYIVFMDNLIDSSEDVSYLRHCGIIEHSLDNDSEVADIFNRLTKDVVFNTSDNYLSELLTQLHDCYKSKYFRKWNAWKRALKHKYFDNPWAYFSFFAAVLLLVLTLVQTYFTVYAYYKASS